VRAIRSAAFNQAGRTPITLPKLSQIESIADPKTLLNNLLRTASGLTGRRMAILRPHTLAREVANHTPDFTPLRQLPAFQLLQADIAEFARQWLTVHPPDPAGDS